MGTLFIVATPIGNREDITLRALKMLSEANIILCEDTRKTKLLLDYYKTSHPELISGSLNKKINSLLSYYEENEEERTPVVIELLKQGKNIALVSNAGTPLISDPGFKLVRECYKEGITVSPIPGPSSVIAALSASGLPTNQFLFLGYLPKKQGKRIKLLNEIKNLRHVVIPANEPESIKINKYENTRQINPTIILFESPFRIQKTLQDMFDVFGNIEITIASELTKIHENFTKSSIISLIQRYKTAKGERVIIF